MPRIRTLKPEFFRSRSLAKCSVEARLTFAGLWTEADDHGRGIADPRILKGTLWPLDDDVTHEHVSSHIRMLIATGHIRLYETDGETYFEIINWEDHQAAAYRRGEPKYPAPETYLGDVSHARMKESEGGTQESAGTRNEEQGTRKEDDADTSPSNNGQVDEQFEDFWDRYPRHAVNGKPGGGGSKKKSLQKWKRLTDGQRKACMDAVDNYREWCQHPDGEYPAHATTWLNEARWEQWQEPADIQPAEVPVEKRGMIA